MRQYGSRPYATPSSGVISCSLRSEQRLFRWLSVCVRGCTLEAAEAICSWPGDEVGHVLDGVASLVDKSLLQRVEHTENGSEDRVS